MAIAVYVGMDRCGWQEDNFRRLKGVVVRKLHTQSAHRHTSRCPEGLNNPKVLHL
jgi:hypothetical protein